MFLTFFYKEFEKKEIQNWELVNKLFLTIGIDYTELDAVLRARRFVLIWQRRVATAHTGGHKANLNLRGKISCRLLSCKIVKNSLILTVYYLTRFVEFRGTVKILYWVVLRQKKLPNTGSPRIRRFHISQMRITRFWKYIPSLRKVRLNFT